MEKPGTLNVPDVQNEHDDREIALDQVGVSSLRYPITVMDRDQKEQHVTATLSMSVDLPHQFKGTHMSRFIEVLKRVDVEIDGREVSLSPGSGFSVGFGIDFDSDAIGKQDMNVQLVNGTFKGEISRARTFGFAEEVDQLRRMGLALGGSLDNAVVVSGDEILNDEGLRYKDEFVRHKILDCVGDLYLAGAQIAGHFQGYRSGHAMNHEIVRALFADPSAWRYAELPETVSEPEPLAATA